MPTPSEREQRILKRSIAITVVFASSGILLGLLSGARSIVFDGLFSVIDTLVLMLALTAARLVQREGDRRFQYGYWHVEPIVLALLTSYLITVPIKTVRQALNEILLITPPEMDQVVRAVMDAVVERHGFRKCTNSVAKVGRAYCVEIYAGVDNQGSYQRLIVAFTADERWI